MESLKFFEGLKGYVETMVKGIVSKPEAVKMSFQEGQQTLICELKVAKEDTGRIIGRGGDTIRSIETLVDVYCRTHCPDKHCVFEFVREKRIEQKPQQSREFKKYGNNKDIARIH